MTIIYLFLFSFLALFVPQPDPAHVAAVCKGEASFAVAECACSVHNRLDAGWRPELVMTAYYAPAAPVEAEEIDLVGRVLAGATPCNPDFYFMLEPASVIALGMSHLAPAGVVTAPDGRRVSFYPRRAWRERSPP